MEKGNKLEQEAYCLISIIKSRVVFHNSNNNGNSSSNIDSISYYNSNKNSYIDNNNYYYYHSNKNKKKNNYNNNNNLNFNGWPNQPEKHVHVGLRLVNGREMVTIIRGINKKKFDYNDILEKLKEGCGCDGGIVPHPYDGGEVVIELEGDQRRHVGVYLAKKGIVYRTYGAYVKDPYDFYEP